MNELLFRSLKRLWPNWMCIYPWCSCSIYQDFYSYWEWRDCYQYVEETMMIRLHLKLNSSKYQNNFKYLILFSNYIFIYFVLEEFTHYGAHTEVREQFEELGSVFLLCGSQKWNSGCQVWQQVPFPAKWSYHSKSFRPEWYFLKSHFSKKGCYLALTLEPGVLRWQRQSSVSLYFYSIIVCEYACVCVCSCTLMNLFSEGLNRGSRTLDLDLLLVISPLMWVVGTKVRSSKKTVNTVDCWAPAHFYYRQTKYNSLAKGLSHTHYEGNDGGTDLGK